MRLLIYFKPKQSGKTSKTYLKLIILHAFLGCFHCVQGQDFCKSNFGDDWVTYFTLPLKQPDFFENDTIIFKRSAIENLEHEYLSLDCKDSTFHIAFVYKVVYDDSTSVWVKSNSADNYGSWKYNAKSNLIIFSQKVSGKIYTFKLVNVGTKATNKHDIWRSDGDYRTAIYLIKMN